MWFLLQLKLTVHEMQDLPVKKMDWEHITVMVHFTCFMSLYAPFVYLMAKLLEERSSGVQVSFNLRGSDHKLSGQDTE